MLEKKTPKGDIDNKRTSFILIGLIIVLSLVYAGFELFASQDKEELIIEDIEEIIIVEDDVLATDQTPPPPPPPVEQQQEVILNLVDDNIKVNTEFDFSQDFDENFAVEEYVPIDIVEEVVDDTPPVRFAEKMPEFIGGMEALYAFLRENLVYPEVARNSGIQGTVLIEFVVERDGSISNVKTLVPLFPECDTEAIRVIKKLPKWKPGEQMGKPVRVFFNLPVRFTLQ